MIQGSSEDQTKSEILIEINNRNEYVFVLFGRVYSSESWR